MGKMVERRKHGRPGKKLVKNKLNDKISSITQSNQRLSATWDTQGKLIKISIFKLGDGSVISLLALQAQGLEVDL